jgi:hypothetical protein
MSLIINILMWLPAHALEFVFAHPRFTFFAMQHTKNGFKICWLTGTS